ncbi:hypothetical protein [Desulfosporosinus sp. SB140]|uniref:hypothetical protein n=1 Tax=Desulfosporosinus paludis TaxID=3115649 RepID=UPI00388DDB2A
MKCPNGIRECPNGWTNCELCANYQMCKAGLYYGEPIEESIFDEPEQTGPEILRQAAEIAEKVTQADAIESAEKIKGTWAERFLTLSPDEGLNEFYSKHTPDLHHKEPLPLDGGVVHGGGSKSKRHKKPPRTMAEYLKTWGV